MFTSFSASQMFNPDVLGTRSVRLRECQIPQAVIYGLSAVFHLLNVSVIHA